ncbi:PHP domain-containing protein, partial [Candidatus Woesearchaeota archaeon]|nr:PHP domain-containing protein [Candidatus Woesearchaeota archaeon]
KNLGVAVTDHHTISGSLEALEKAKEKGVLVIPGIEIAVFEGPHLLFYFHGKDDMKEFHEKYVKDFVKYKSGRSRISIAKYVELAEDYNCLMSVAHPGERWISNLFKCLQTYNLKELREKIYALEVINGLNSQLSNISSIFAARNLKTRITGGSDGHNVLALGKVVTSSYGNNVDDLLESLRNRQNNVIGRPIGIFAKKFLYGSGAIKHNFLEARKLWRPSAQWELLKYLKLQVGSYLNGRR